MVIYLFLKYFLMWFWGGGNPTSLLHALKFKEPWSTSLARGHDSLSCCGSPCQKGSPAQVARAQVSFHPQVPKGAEHIHTLYSKVISVSIGTKPGSNLTPHSTTVLYPRMDGKNHTIPGWNKGTVCRMRARAPSPAKHHTWCTATVRLLIASVKGSLSGLPKDAWNSWISTLDHSYQAPVEKHGLLLI